LKTEGKSKGNSKGKAGESKARKRIHFITTNLYLLPASTATTQRATSIEAAQVPLARSVCGMSCCHPEQRPMTSVLSHEISRTGWADALGPKVWKIESSASFLEPVFQSHVWFGISSLSTANFLRTARSSIFFGPCFSSKCTQTKARRAVASVVRAVLLTPKHSASGSGSLPMQFANSMLRW